MGADTTAELWVNDHPVSDANPVPTAPAPGGGATTVEQGTPGVAPWLVDDDATQAVLTAMAGGKSLNDLLVELQTLAAAKTLADIVTALGFSKNAGAADATTLRVVNASDGPTVAALGTITDAAAGDANGSINAHVRQAAKALNGGLPAALAAHGGLVVEGVASGVAIPVDSELPAAAALSDTDANPTAPYVGAANMRWFTNAGNWVRERATDRTTLLSSGARTASNNSSDVNMWTWRGVIIIIDVTSITNAPSITAALQLKDSTASKYLSLLTTGAITATGTYALILHAGAPTVAASPLWAVGYQTPEIIRVAMTHGNSDSITYSVAMHMLP